eukprot:Blabericola_migrator_1__9671@NODE_528_length_7829_cov_105_974749_g403_i0_p5_GENE_NODE_528_length_7829_cov_105_974749_g403_i0NODE_528_length_7829_cov_105_974749_g403_i0_p5_ORF_typecomplete_len181_score10_63_NODE_528_length_7829_cov_105_974749_g403_i016432185
MVCIPQVTSAHEASSQPHGKGPPLWVAAYACLGVSVIVLIAKRLAHVPSSTGRWIPPDIIKWPCQLTANFLRFLRDQTIRVIRLSHDVRRHYTVSFSGKVSCLTSAVSRALQNSRRCLIYITQDARTAVELHSSFVRVAIFIEDTVETSVGFICDLIGQAPRAWSRLTFDERHTSGSLSG